MQRVDLQDALVVARGLLGVLDDLLADQGDLDQHLGAPREIVGRARSAIVQSFEIAPALGRREDVLQALEGGLVAGGEGEHTLEVRRRADRIAQTIFVQACGALAELDLQRFGQSTTKHLAECFSQIRRATRGLSQLIGALPQPELARVLTNGLEHDVEGAAVRAQFLLLSVGQAQIQRQTQRRILGLAEQDTERVRFAARLTGGRILRGQHISDARAHGWNVEQALEHGHGAALHGRRVDREHGVLQRVFRAREQVLVVLGELHLALGAFVTPIVRELLAVLLDDLDRTRGVVLREEQAGQRGQRRRVRVVHFQDATVQRHGALGRLEHVLFERGPVTKDRNLGLVVCSVLHAQLEQPAQVITPIFTPQDRFQRARDFDVGGIAFQHLLVEQDRLLRATELFGEHARQTQLEQATLAAGRGTRGRGRRLGHGFALLLLLALARRSGRRLGGSSRYGRRRGGLGDLQALFDGFDEGIPGARGARRVFQQIERGRALRGELVGLARVLRGRFTVVQALARNFHQLTEQRELLRFVVRALEEQLVQRGQARPLLVLLVERDERAGCARIRRIRGQDAVVGAERALRLIQLLLVDRGRAVAELDALRRFLGAVGSGAEHLGQAIPIVL